MNHSDSLTRGAAIRVRKAIEISVPNRTPNSTPGEEQAE
jgi:hypothetical protein